MSHEALSPEQFGFLPPLKWDDQSVIGDNLRHQSWDRKKISLKRPSLRANHDIFSDAVNYYEKNPRGNFTGDPDRNPTVVKYKGEHVILSGHHRIAAALRRNQKSMIVDYGEVD